MAPAAVEMARPPARIPKLKYRNHLPADQSSLTSLDSSPTISRTISTESRHSDPFVDLPPTPTSATDSFRQSSDSRSTTSSSTSLDSSHGSTTRGSAMSAKKKRGVFGFLTVKEPSQLALEQFAKSQRQQAAAKGGGPSPVSLQGISPAKLPANVPKVNSKWDGVPDSVKSAKSSISPKKKDSSSVYASGSIPKFRDSRNMSMFSVASVASRGAPNSLASSMVNVSLSNDPVRSHTPPLHSTATGTLPGVYNFSPENKSSMSGALPVSSSHVEEVSGPPPSLAEHPWSPPPLPPQQALEAFPLFETEEPNPSSTPTEQSYGLLKHRPEEAHVKDKADAIFKRLKGNDGFLAGEAREVKLDESDIDADDDDPELVPESHGFLFEVQPLPTITTCQLPPSPVRDRPSKGPSTNFSRPRPLQLASYKSATSSSLPTLYECSSASTDTITNLPEEGTTPTTPTTSVTRSDSSPTPTRSSSSRDRLGLGGRIRKTEMLPWEKQGESLGKASKRSRLSVFSKGST